MAQKLDESAEDFISRVTKKAKYIPNIDESLLCSSKVYAHRSAPTSCKPMMADLLQAARVADVAATSSDPTFQQLLSEIRHSNEQHTKHNAAFKLLRSRFNNMNVSSSGANDTCRSRSPSPRRVRFTTPPRRPTSSGYDYSRSNDDRRSSDDRPLRRYYNDNNTCPRCGMEHRYDRCPAINAQCLNCGRVGHFRRTCRQARRSQFQRERTIRPRI